MTRGEHDAVKAMLKKDMSLIFKRGVATDCSGREFENVSSFEYALWALDKHMWAAMIACIPQNEEGRKVFAQLIAQYNKVNTDGVTYKLNGQTITEKHFDFNNTIIKELQTQVDSINAPGTKNWDAIDKQWREGVGGAQNLFPMHVVYEYCSDEPFYPVRSLPHSRSHQNNSIIWRLKRMKIGLMLILSCRLIVRYLRPGAGVGRCARRLGPRLGRGAFDLNAMTALCKVRTNDFIDLKSQLEDQMTLANHHQVS